MSTRLTRVVDRPRPCKRPGGDAYTHMTVHLVWYTVLCMYVHVFFGVKHTVLISVKKIHPSALNNAQAQNNARFLDAY